MGGFGMVAALVGAGMACVADQYAGQQLRMDFDRRDVCYRRLLSFHQSHGTKFTGTKLVSSGGSFWWPRS
jgi:hypothetical protein